MASFDRAYGMAATVIIPIPKAGDTDFSTSADWTPQAGDVKISKDGGDVANIETLPVAVGGAGSVLWKFTLSATEMQAQEVVVQVVNAALEHQVFIVDTGVASQALRALGLAQENFFEDSFVYDGAGRLTSSRMRLYDTKANAEAHGVTGLLETYTVTATYDGNGRLASYLCSRDGS